MSKKQVFIDYVQDLMNMANAPAMSEEAKIYWDAFCLVEEVDKPLFTDNGKMILKFLQDNQKETMWKARDIAEGLFINSRAVPGTMRKLVTEGYVEKIGQDPVVYTLTEKGKNKEIV